MADEIRDTITEESPLLTVFRKEAHDTTIQTKILHNGKPITYRTLGNI